MELNKVLIGMIFAIVIFSGMFIFIADGSDKYGVVLPDGYTNSMVAIKATLSQINTTTNQVQTDLTIIEGQSGVLDFLGFFFSGGYDALKTTAKLVGVSFIFVDEGINGIGGGGEFGSLLKTGLYASIIVLLFIGIMMHAIIKSDRL